MSYIIHTYYIADVCIQQHIEVLHNFPTCIELVSCAADWVHEYSSCATSSQSPKSAAADNTTGSSGTRKEQELLPWLIAVLTSQSCS